MVQVITGDQADTPITHILTGIAGPGGTATGAIGKGSFAYQNPQPESENLYRSFTTLT
jgi:hypothetical protein